MHLFGEEGRPRLVHLKTRGEPAGAVVITWDVRHARALRWRVLRSEDGPAAGPFDDTVVGGGQTLVSDQETPGSRDDHPEPGATYFYTIFGEDEHGNWLLLASPKVAVAEHPSRSAEDDFESGATRSGWLDAAWALRAGSGAHPHD